MIPVTRGKFGNLIHALHAVASVVVVVTIFVNLLLAAFCHHWHAFLPTHRQAQATLTSDAAGRHEAARYTRAVGHTHSHVHPADSHAATAGPDADKLGMRSRLTDPDKIPFGSDLLPNSGSHPMVVTDASVAVRFVPRLWWIVVPAVLTLPAIFLPPPEKPPSSSTYTPACALRIA